MTSYRSQLGDGDDLSHLHIATSASGCPGGTLFNMYFEREGTTQPVSLNPNPVPITQVILPNLPAGASHGRYWAAAVNPQTGVEFKNSPAVNDGLHSTGADTGSEPGEASRNLRFAHLDHLGSTRVISDEAGAVVARLKFYPFGMEAETSGGDATRMKFTGHERDDDVHVDYMLARFYAAGLGRFLSTDPLAESALPIRPRTWNRYSYVHANPLVLVDPDGLLALNELEKTVQDRIRAELETVSHVLEKELGSKFRGQAAVFESKHAINYQPKLSVRDAHFAGIPTMGLTGISGDTKQMFLPLKAYYGYMPGGPILADGELRGWLYLGGYSSTRPGQEGVDAGIESLARNVVALQIKEPEFHRIIDALRTHMSEFDSTWNKEQQAYADRWHAYLEKMRDLGVATLQRVGESGSSTSGRDSTGYCGADNAGCY